jgi:hypothetical protein
MNVCNVLFHYALMFEGDLFYMNGYPDWGYHIFKMDIQVLLVLTVKILKYIYRSTNQRESCNLFLYFHSGISVHVCVY